jgi:hypothetical protein
MLTAESLRFRHLAAALILGALARLLALPQILGAAGPAFAGGPDAYYHLRRVELLLAGRLGAFDQWTNYPFGASTAHLPETYTRLLAAAFTLGGPVGMMLLPLLFGLLTILLVARLGRDRPHAGATLLLYAVLPAGAFLSAFGAIDHHAVEAFFFALGLLGNVWALPAVLGAFLTTPTWPVVVVAVVAARLLAAPHLWLNRFGLIFGLLSLHIAGWSYFSDPWLAEVREFRPVWASLDAFLESFRLLSLGLVALPFALVLWWHERANPRTAALLAGGIVALPLALLYARFHVFLAVPGALAVGEAIAGVARTTPRLRRAFVFAVFLIAVAGLAEIAVMDPDPSPEIRLALETIRETTPPAGDPLDPGTRPEYGVVADWDLGHAILALGRRPVLAGGFHTGARGRQLAEIILYSPPREATIVADAERARILLLIPRRVGGDGFSLYERLYVKGERDLGWRPIHLSDESITPDDGIAIPSIQVWQRVME